MKLLIFAAAVLILMSSCSYRSDRAPAPAATAADLLVNSGEWLTISGTLLRPDSTELQIPAGNPFLKTLLLYNVTFYRNGTAVDTNDPNGLTANGLTWKLTGRHLLVRINDNNTDKVDALILELSLSKLVLRVSDYYDYQGTTYTGLIQTFGH